MEPLRFALLGLGAGGVYALIALGVVLVYRGSGVLNFAQGAIGMTGAFMFYDLQSSAGWPLAAAAVAAAMFSAALGIAIHLLVMRRLRDSSGLAALIATLAVWLFLRGIAGELWGFDARLPDRILPSSRVSLLNTSVGADRLIVCGVVRHRDGSGCRKPRRERRARHIAALLGIRELGVRVVVGDRRRDPDRAY